MSTTAMTTSMITTMLMANSVASTAMASGGTAYNLPLLGQILLFVIFNLILLGATGAFLYMAYESRDTGNVILIGIPTLFGVISLLTLVFLWVLALG